MLTKLIILKNLVDLSPNFWVYLKNSGWMVSEQVVRVFSALVVSIYIARNLGPEQFGRLSYSIAIFGISVAACRLAMDSILVRELSSERANRVELLSSAFLMILIASAISFLFIVVFAMLIETDPNSKMILIVIAVGLLFQCFYVIDFDFQSKLNAKNTSIAKSIALIVGSLAKIFMVVSQASVLSLAWMYTLEASFLGVLFVWLKHKHNIKFSISYANLATVRRLTSSAWPMVLSSLSVVLYMRTDQLMIKSLIGLPELGRYSAMSKVYEGWVMFSFVLSMSLLPVIAKLKSYSNELYQSRLIGIYTIIFWTALIFSVVVYYSADWIVLFVYGIKYSGSENVMRILMFASVFTGIGAMNARFLTVEKMERKLALRAMAALTLNVVLNFLLLPIWGIEGAAISTLLTVFFSNYLFNYFDPELKSLVYICNRAIFLYRIKK